MIHLPLVARSYTDVVRWLRVRKEACKANRTVLVATPGAPDTTVLAALSELAMAGAYLSAPAGQQVTPPMRMEVGLTVSQSLWQGEIRAVATAARTSRGGWILDCEIRDDRQRLLSTAFAYVPAD